MKYPDWFPEWRHDAVHQLQDKNARLASEFQLGGWPRYDYDFDAGTLIFSQHGVPKVIAEIQIAGTTSTEAGNWLWAWANAHLPSNLVTDSTLARAFGEEHGISDLTGELVEEDGDLNALGMEANFNRGSAYQRARGLPPAPRRGWRPLPDLQEHDVGWLKLDSPNPVAKRR